MKPSPSFRFLAIGIGLAFAVGGCAAEEQEGEGPQFPKAPIGSDSTEQLASPPPEAPGEAPTPIETVPVASAPAAPPAPPTAAAPREIVPG
jgi:hypothetical protein